MFTAKPQKNRTAATQYFDEHLSHNDYYTQQETQAGYWIGQGVERLGLRQGDKVGRDEFLRLCDNLHPQDGTKLTQLKLSERGGIFFDFTCSTPKSVSILAVTMGDTRIVEAHREAANVALRSWKPSPRPGSGRMEPWTIGPPATWSERRFNTPPPGRSIPSSTPILPCSMQRSTRSSSVGRPCKRRAVFEAIHYGTAVYRNELASRLHALGYQTRQTAHGFEVEGVKPDIIERFSKRAQQRNAARRPGGEASRPQVVQKRD